MTRAWSAVFIAGCAAALAGCGSYSAPASPTSPSSPLSPLTISISGPATVTSHDTTVGTDTAHVCYYQMLASTSGGAAGQIALWGTGHETRILVSSGETVSKTITGAAFFGSDQLPAGTQETGNGYAYWSGPFSESLTFYYSTPQSTTDSVTYQYKCQ